MSPNFCRASASAEKHGRLVEGHKAVSVHGFRELKMEISTEEVITYPYPEMRFH